MPCVFKSPDGFPEIPLMDVTLFFGAVLVNFGEVFLISKSIKRYQKISKVSIGLVPPPSNSQLQ